MKSEFQAKFLQHLAQKREEKGFTLIELLVVIIIIGILSAIALPSFLNQANKAKESEAKQYVGSMNRTQQAYFLEKNTFSSDISLLGLGIKTQTTNYTYGIASPGASSAINYGQSQNTTTLRHYVGGVQVGQTAGNEATTLATLCQSTKPTSAASSTGVGFNAATNSVGPTCAANFENLGG